MVTRSRDGRDRSDSRGDALGKLPDVVNRGLAKYVPPTDCKRCSGTGYARADDEDADPFKRVFCDCAKGVFERRRDQFHQTRQRALELADMRATLDKTLDFSDEERAYTLDTYPRKTDPAYRMVRAFLQSWDWKRNLILRGDVGAGKTGLMVAALHVLRPHAEQTGRVMRYITSIELYDRLKRAMNDAKSGGTPLEVVLDRYRRCALLAIDDIGKENRTDWTSERLFDVLNDRHRHGRPTWITSNLRKEQRITGSGVVEVDRLEEWLDPALWSRLQQRGDLIEFTGPDLR